MNSGSATPSHELQRTVSHDFRQADVNGQHDFGFRRQQTIATENPSQHETDKLFQLKAFTGQFQSPIQANPGPQSGSIYDSQLYNRSRASPASQYYSNRTVPLHQPGVVTADKLSSLYSKPVALQQATSESRGSNQTNGALNPYNLRNLEAPLQPTNDQLHQGKISHNLAENLMKNRVAKVTRYSYNADGTKTLLSDELVSLDSIPNLLDGPVPGASSQVNQLYQAKSRTSFQNGINQASPFKDFASVSSKPSTGTQPVHSPTAPSFTHQSFSSQLYSDVGTVPTNFRAPSQNLSQPAGPSGPVVVEVDMNLLRRYILVISGKALKEARTVLAFRTAR